ncbi:helix-turn-helix transcriptional regulator [Nocardioides mangrovi]|uniref:Helix-turn-helix transcriptional regulator n=1 Tax=Nocardioides mangrovi TaxID=2874580 RepID=A0ABS7UB02_9ACTN|nr:helix-turn-helix transcriptional regulator [Nocardioides mangrovi]MBZ5737987.1 helix-turn-helix transcriptional regulator [Nocardioides mangrovi]
MTPEDLPVGVGQGPGSRIPSSARQAVLDAAAVLQVRRTEAAAEAARGRLAEGEIVAIGMKAISEWMASTAETWGEILSVRPTATVAQLRAGLPANRAGFERGVSMVSVFDFYGTSAEGRILLANEPVGGYLLGCGPVQMKIIDRRSVLLEGPEVDGFPSLMSVGSAACMEAAWRYWEAVLASCVPADAPSERTAGEFTRRQRQVIALMASDLGDDAIAASLGVSVRTVRADIAGVLAAVGVRTRFAAAVRLHRLISEPD